MMELRPIIIDANGMILGGNMRFKALQKLKYKDIPETWVKRAETLTGDETKRFIIEDNVPFGEWDWETLANEWDKDQLIEWGLEIPDFAFNKLEAQEDDYEIPEGGADTDIIMGDLFEIGKHRLLCGDSTSREDVEKLMNNYKADMIFTDPPYGVDYEGGSKKWEKLKGDTQGFEKFYRAVGDMLDFVKGEASLYVCFAGMKSDVVFTALKESGVNLKNMIIWAKNNAQFGMLGANYHQKHEPILFGCKGNKYHWHRPKNEVTVWEIKRASKNEYHSTQKPIELVGRAINNSSKEDDLILDLFGGGGSTMIASHQLKRICYMQELNPRYCQVIIDRMRKLDPDIVIKKNGNVLH